MERFLVHEQAVDGPATHALLVGVGRYPHLIGGTGPLLEEHGGMRQLSSPPLSAVAFAEWLTKSFSNPDRPLSTVAVLTAGEADVEFTHPVSGAKTALEQPTFAHFEAAVKAWKKRGDESPENMVLLYFCGHGMANGPDLALVMQDYGEDPATKFDSVLDFRLFRLGMEHCKARRQCFFIDACRAADSSIMEAAGHAGRPIFTPTTRYDRNLPVRQRPAFYSTFAGHKAQSRTGKVSLFTGAMLRAFRGGGADDTSGDWWVDTNQLQKCVQFLMERAQAQGYPAAQVNPVDDMSTFELHRLDGDPEVPVLVTCRPEGQSEVATLEVRSGGSVVTCEPCPGGWDLDLAYGRYRFEAVPESGPPTAPKEVSVRPAFRKVPPLEVQP